MKSQKGFEPGSCNSSIQRHGNTTDFLGDNQNANLIKLVGLDFLNVCHIWYNNNDSLHVPKYLVRNLLHGSPTCDFLPPSPSLLAGMWTQRIGEWMWNFMIDLHRPGRRVDRITHQWSLLGIRQISCYAKTCRTYINCSADIIQHYNDFDQTYCNLLPTKLISWLNSDGWRMKRFHTVP